MTDLLPNPCHLVDTAWVDLDASRGYDDIAVDITVETDPGETAGYYYANTVYFTRSRVDSHGRLAGAAYAGLQTNGYSGPEDGWVGKMALFSAWGATGAIAESGGWGSEFDEGGSGYSVRLRYAWQEGITYRLRIGLDEERDGDTVWSASLTEGSTGNRTRIGRVIVPASFGKIRRPITFHERYSGTSRSIDDIEPSQVRFTNMAANDGAVRSAAWQHTARVSLRKHKARFRHVELEAGFMNGVGLPKPARD